MEVKKGDKVMLDLAKAAHSGYHMAITGLYMDDLEERKAYTVIDTTMLLATIPAVKLEGKGYWHPIDIFTIKNEKMKDLTNLEKGDKLVCIQNSTDQRPLKKGVTYTFSNYGNKGEIGIKETIYFYPAEWFKLAKDDTLREGDEVETFQNIARGKEDTIIFAGTKYIVSSISDDGKFITVKMTERSTVSPIFPSSLFRKVKVKKTEEKITIGTGNKVATITIRKDEIGYNIKYAGIGHFGKINIEALKKMREVYNKVYTVSTTPIQLVDKDAKIFLIGCSDVDFRVSLRNLEDVIKIADTLD